MIDNIEYDIVLCSNRLCFDVRDYGLEPEWISTDCWDGHWERYSIDDKGLMIKDLYIHTKDNGYPRINGIKPRSFIVLAILSLFKLTEIDEEQREGYHKYENINCHINYSGKIILGKGLKTWRGMGYELLETVFAYENVIELEFVDGKLIRKEGISSIISELRNKVDENQSDSVNWSIILDNMYDYLNKNQDKDNWWIKVYDTVNIIEF